MKKTLLATIVMALLAALALSAIAEQPAQSALEAFNSLTVPDDSTLPLLKTADGYLDDIMAGKYALDTADADAAQRLAPYLEPLSAITNKDIAAYASTHGMKVAQVRNAYYRALADVLKAEIAVNPASEEQYRNVQMILSLFLEPASETEQTTRETIRSTMSRAYSQKIAQDYSLPVAFVEFVIMNDDWDDDNWDNDDDWQNGVDWDDMVEDAFEDITIGSRDSNGSTRIADLQELLINLGYLSGKADGIFGPRTQSALLEFQMANGLAATGAYSASNRAKLSEAGVVARWDYDYDFWDSRDYDSYDTPDYPGDTPDYDTPYDNYDTPWQNYGSAQSAGSSNNSGGSGSSNSSGSSGSSGSSSRSGSSSSNRYDTPNTPDYDTPAKYDTPKKSTSSSSKGSRNYDTPDTPDYDTPD